jgi:phage/plasmid-like protein (TIGR03299 family)
MPADIFNDSFVEVKRPVSAWHRLGKRVEAGVRPSTVVDELIPYAVNKRQAGYLLPDGTWKPIHNKFHLVRTETPSDPHERDFGLVSGTYEYEQPHKLFKQLDAVADVWPLETFGVLGKGEKVFMLFNTGETKIAGDPFSNYLLFVEHLDGKHAHEQLFTGIRVVCQNTVTLALDTSISRASVQHTREFKTEFINVLELMTSLTDAKDKFTDIMGRMMHHHLLETELAKMLDTAVPMPTKKGVVEMAERTGAVSNDFLKNATDRWLAASQRASSQRGAIMTEFGKLNLELPDRAGSAYNFVQAVAAFVDHRPARGVEASMSPAIGSGSFMKDRAFRTAAELVGVE